MNANEAQGNATSQSVVSRQHKRATYQKVLDGRKQPIRGLYKRNGSFYGRLTVADDATGRKTVRRVTLKDDAGALVATLPQAIKAFDALKVDRKRQTLPVLQRTPKFDGYADAYLAYYEIVKDAKRPRTLETERGHLTHWREHLGATRLDRINKAMINDFIAKRQAAGISGRTINLGMTVLRNVLNKGIDDGFLKCLPTDNLRPLKWTARKRELFTEANIDSVCEIAINGVLNEKGEIEQSFKNGRQFADFLRLTAYCGSRLSETLRLKWSDVDFAKGILTIGADGLSKNHETRYVQFNPKLEAQLIAMSARRAPDTDWMFPSAQRGDKDIRAKSFRDTLNKVRKAAKLEKFGFHDCRHFFISMAVMSGIDYMTIARWVGHKDGGILIGKVYGHLSNEHAQRQAQRLNFGPVALDEKAETLLNTQ
jgi:integrase